MASTARLHAPPAANSARPMVDQRHEPKRASALFAASVLVLARRRRMLQACTRQKLARMGRHQWTPNPKLAKGADRRYQCQVCYGHQYRTSGRSAAADRRSPERDTNADTPAPREAPK
jgi:hypothetical protein